MLQLRKKRNPKIAITLKQTRYFVQLFIVVFIDIPMKVGIKIFLQFSVTF
jgi:hypothetical protein